MANRAYVSVWCRGFCEDTLLGLFEKLLGTVPFSPSWPGYASLVIQAVGPEESPLAEHDLRAFPATASEVAEMAREHLHNDSAYEVTAAWDLWAYDGNVGRWKQQPQRLQIICHGEEYDEGVYGEMGHFLIEVGLEHLFTGHGNLLGFARERSAPQHPAEAEFLSRMAEPERLREYQEKTRENIAKLQGWMKQIERALPVERYQLWSEGEENFEARVDEILALR